jgi:predicted RNA-binding Zn-ribbon protein involved in translation (DUF1610 family)
MNDAFYNLERRHTVERVMDLPLAWLEYFLWRMVSLFVLIFTNKFPCPYCGKSLLIRDTGIAKNFMCQNVKCKDFGHSRNGICH